MVTTGYASMYRDVSVKATYSVPVQIPTAPSGLAATTTDATKVRVTWSSASGATSYKVYRNTSSSSSTATQIGTSSSTLYDDTTVTPGTTYYYWVKASNSGGDSTFSASATGRRLLSAPVAVAASQGAYADKVRVTWTSAVGATSYKVFRNATDNSAEAGQIGTTTSALLYDDTTATPGTTYYYWVKASASTGDSAFSASAQGFTEEPSTETSHGVPFSWLDTHYPGNNGDYEALASSRDSSNGYLVWELYVIGFENPSDPANRFTARVEMVDGQPVITWVPDLDGERDYTLFGKPSLDVPEWAELDPDNIDSSMRFFKVSVDLPQHGQ